MKEGGRNATRRVWIVALLAYVFVTAASFLGEFVPFADLLAHARLPLAIFGCIGFVSDVVRPMRLTARAWAVLAIVNAAPIAALYREVDPPAIEDPVELRALLFNVRVENPNKQAIADWIHDEAFDVVVIQEATEDLCDRIDTRGSYRRVAADLQEGESAKRSSALHVRTDRGIEVEHVVVHRQHETFGTLAMLEARLRRGDSEFVVLAPRLAPSVTLARYRSRARMLDLLIDRASMGRSEGRSVLVLADLNTTPFAHDYADLLRRAELRDASAGCGYRPTFHGSGFLALARIPIDFVLVSEDVAVRDHVVADRFGSDYHPIVASLELPRRTSHGK